MTTKKCTKCGETKPTEQFYKNSASKDGLHPQCKTCIAARNRAYYEANREERKAYREANREHIAASNSAYREANREQIAAQKRARYALVGDPSGARTRAVTSRYSTRNRAPWTPEEDRYLLTGPGTLMDKALQLSRTYSAVNVRAHRLRQEQTA